MVSREWSVVSNNPHKANLLTTHHSPLTIHHSQFTKQLTHDPHKSIRSA